MKISVSVPDDALAILDDAVRTRGFASRSAAVQYAIQQLRFPELEDDYAAAWDDWSASGDESAWTATAADGV